MTLAAIGLFLIYLIDAGHRHLLGHMLGIRIAVITLIGAFKVESWPVATTGVERGEVLQHSGTV
ncbi:MULTISPECIES: hypothetical protein [unclassified Shinella]|uniref:hypothetical protein n=1 Tax=unclassified Shinella TaxID=2643062 RepID=UPI00225CA7BA|nr:hypothetical protein [Shinella sp. YE25]MDC7254553.1 hypothetical protein [Shinella sp. YE25]CAI0337273.1 hypothetical protein SHINE37_41127 [Rhizobiaceae bacterium]CAK7255769.1 protein of unknown function [Shinella sp. WSC3-e]